MPESPSVPDGPASSVAAPKIADVGAGVELDLGLSPDASEIARIVDRDDPVLRNLEITLGYYRLSHALRRLLGPGNANWCTFAAWASRRAGQSIRGEDLGTLRGHLRRRLERDEAFRDALRRVGLNLPGRHVPFLSKDRVIARVLALVDEVAVSVAEGNLKVFAELAPPFADFAAEFAGDTALDEAKLGRFVSRFASGSTAEGGQDLLRSAFTSFAHALFEPDPKAKAELLLLANIQVGLHEQTRLQPNIAAALTAPIEHLGNWLAEDIRAKVPFGSNLARRLRIALLAPVLTVVGRIWREEATRHLTTLPVPGEVLGLGSDIPSLPGLSMFPPLLEELANATLITLLQQHDRTWNSTLGTGAMDWSNLADRMHYIADLFRSRQQQPTLYHAPFAQEQCRAILDGRIPAGRF